MRAQKWFEIREEDKQWHKATERVRAARLGRAVAMFVHGDTFSGAARKSRVPVPELKKRSLPKGLSPRRGRGSWRKTIFQSYSNTSARENSG
jgi:hypothetical protein